MIAVLLIIIIAILLWPITLFLLGAFGIALAAILAVLWIPLSIALALFIVWVVFNLLKTAVTKWQIISTLVAEAKRRAASR